jgi:DNA-binding IclR family transcriptional regulator
MCCVAVPLFNQENILIGAVGISGSKQRLKTEKIDDFGIKLTNIVSSYELIC